MNCVGLVHGWLGNLSLRDTPCEGVPLFAAVPPEVDLVALEEAELRRWNEHGIFQASIAQRADAPQWVFYEGPPSANGRPGLHHVWARSYKDLLCRFQTMRGHRVERRAGWDTHGLPVEVQVEKALGISGKQDIEEKIGIAEFTRRCKESVLDHVEEWRAVTERIGYWVDLDDAYWTFDPAYIESVWWQLQQMFNKGLLYEDLKVIPYCPRCGTALSSHELGQPGVYTDETEESAYVLLPLVDADRAIVGDATALVVWTTTPWTLLSNAGAAVNPTVTYAVANGLIVAEALVASVLGEDAVITTTMLGADLVGLRYERPFDDLPVEPGMDGWRVVPADYVTTEDGTGIVHQSPAFGEIDRVVARAHGLPTFNPVGPDGCFTDAVSWLAGQEVRAANSAINDALAAKGRLLRRMDYTHALPHCWRCTTTLIYWGKPSWYLATSTVKDQMLALNETIDWHPASIQHGRFGDWLANNVDWALSRDRYWGTPLPIWRCEDGHVTCIGSRAELSTLAGRDVSNVDPHRPAIDEVTFPCPTCAATATRVAPVIDVWFDSGAMPLAQVGYPHVAGSAAALQYPADYISEAIDQTRGWFYSLLAVNTLLNGTTPYKHVMSLGHIVDAEGKKMSKSKGNVIDPWEILSTRGADALRWWMFSQGSPWASSRVSFEVIDNALRMTMLTWWNTFSFFTTYASLNGFSSEDPRIPAEQDRPALDRWILSRLATCVDAVTAGLEGYEPLGAAQAVQSLIDDVSNWYVRRSRRRFWRTEAGAPVEDSLAAQATLHTVLVELSLVMAPMTPFVADVMWRALTGASATESVHLASWPEAKPERRSEALEEQMAVTRRLTSLGRSSRNDAGVKVRQPLGRALVFLAPGSAIPLFDVVADELNVDVVELAEDLSSVLTYELVPNFKRLGPRLGESVQHLRGALAALDGAAVAATFDAGGTVSVDLNGVAIKLTAEDLDLRMKGDAAFAVTRDGSEVVALDLTIDDALFERGLVRDLIRHIQDLRKSSGFEVSDHIDLVLDGAAFLQAHGDLIASEVLADSLSHGAGTGSGTAIDLDGQEVTVWISQVTGN